MNLPNFLTLLRIALSPVFMVLIIIENPYSRVAATLVFTVAALTDLADGYFARRMAGHTGFGRFMDPLADKILVSTAFLAFIPLGYARAWMVIIIVAREILITGLRSMAAYKGMIISSSFLAKGKTVAQMVAIGIILIYANVEALVLAPSADPAGLSPPGIPAWSLPAVGWGYNLFDVVIMIPLILTVWTGIDYLVKTGGLLKGVLK